MTGDELRRTTGAGWKRTKMLARKGAGSYCATLVQTFPCLYSWAGYGQSNSVADVPTVLKSNVITFLCFASLHACKLTRATCKVRTVVCSCGFYPFVTIIYGSHCTWSIV
uniref:Uncharacterized protein n=1 Tax=Rhipicephalus zambeziensis TaxID=60191 RepID=A0A224YCT5_9ACAR